MKRPEPGTPRPVLRPYLLAYHNEKLAWTLASLMMLAALLWPALWNGFPIVYYDTGGYLRGRSKPRSRWVARRSDGAFLALGIKQYFWPNIIVQAALVAWLVALTLRLHGLGGRPWLASAIVIGLCAMTGLSWYTAQLMPDILASACVLALAILAFYPQALRRWETAILVVVIAAAIASHMSILALALGLVAILAAQRLLSKPIALPQPTLALPAAAVALGVLLAPLSNFTIADQLAFTPGGFNFVFSRLVEDGVVERYLADHCPDLTIRLCAYRAELSRTADVGCGRRKARSTSSAVSNNSSRRRGGSSSRA